MTAVDNYYLSVRCSISDNGGERTDQWWPVASWTNREPDLQEAYNKTLDRYFSGTEIHEIAFTQMVTYTEVKVRGVLCKDTHKTVGEFKLKDTTHQDGPW